MKTKRLTGKQLRVLVESVMNEAPGSPEWARTDVMPLVPDGPRGPEERDDADVAIETARKACEDAMDELDELMSVQTIDARRLVERAWVLLADAQKAKRESNR